MGRFTSDNQPPNRGRKSRELKAIERFFQSDEGHQLKDALDGNGKSHSGRSVRGILKGLGNNPVTTAILPEVLSGVGIVSSVIACWNAEKHIKGFPPFLHTLMSIFDLVVMAMNVEYAQEIQDQVFNTAGCDFPKFDVWIDEQNSFIKAGWFSYARGIYTVEKLKYCKGGE